MKKAFFTASLLILALSLHAEEPVGFLQYLDGEFIHFLNGEEIAFELGSPLYRNSRIVLTEGNNRGVIRIATRTGLRTVNTFPKNGFPGNKFKQIDEKFQGKLIDLCAGSMIGGKGGADDLFDWFMEIDTLKYSDIEDNNLHLVLSPYSDSESTDSYNPLTYRLKAGLEIEDIDFVIYSGNRRTTFLEQYTGKMAESNGNWSFRFDYFPYCSAETYTVQCSITLADGKKIPWEFTYRILGPEEIAVIEKRAVRKLTGDETEFEKKLALLSSYKRARVYLTIMEIAREIGL